MPGKDEKSRSARSDIADDAQIDEWKQARTGAITLPAHVAGSGALDRLVETARDYAKQAASDNTRQAYAKDWAHVTSRKVIWLFFEQLWFEFVPVLHRLQGRLAAQG